MTSPPSCCLFFSFGQGDKWAPWEGKLWKAGCYTDLVSKGSELLPFIGSRVKVKGMRGCRVMHSCAHASNFVFAFLYPTHNYLRHCQKSLPPRMRYPIQWKYMVGNTWITSPVVSLQFLCIAEYSCKGVMLLSFLELYQRGCPGSLGLPYFMYSCLMS